MPGCSAKIVCNATDNYLCFTITDRDPDFLHDPKIKRRILPVDRPALEERLDGKSAHKVYAEMLDEEMSEDDVEPSIVPNKNQMRKVKEFTDHARDVGPFKSLSKLQREFPKAIQRIGYDPFFVMYMTPLQLAFCKGEAKRREGIYSVDASGLGTMIHICILG